MKIKNGFVLRTVGGQSVVVPIGEMSKNFQGMINLNSTGAYLWDFFSQEHTKEEAVDKMLTEFDAPKDLIAGEVDKFIKVLEKHGFWEV